jgi:hypothetical protein
MLACLANIGISGALWLMAVAGLKLPLARLGCSVEAGVEG